MARKGEQWEQPKPVANDLASYRRLIKLQKQMIELSQRHECSRRECEALRDAVAREAVARQGLLGRLRVSATKLFKRSPIALARQLFS
ncbi:MAG: hypothetical protein M9920_12235 [Verrucomicrobiae bacterium]|nr:hypothetical protein [Verrucomicrobiae bacterium]